MAKVQFLLRTKKPEGTISIRLSEGRKFVCYAKTDVVTKTRSWDTNNQRVKNVARADTSVNIILADLESLILKQLESRIRARKTVDSEWLQDVVWTQLNPKKARLAQGREKTHFIDFCEMWLKEYSKTYISVKTRTNISDSTIGTYVGFVKHFKRFLTETKKDLKFESISSSFIRDYIKYMEEDLEYAYNTKKNNVSLLVFFCKRAIHNFKLHVHPDYNEPCKIRKEEKVLEQYLNPEEIEKVVNYRCIDDQDENIRQWFVIGLYSGMRFSDLINSTDNNKIHENHFFVECQKTETSSAVVATVPIHPHVRAIFEQHGGFPPFYTKDNKIFNNTIRFICKRLHFKNEVRGYKKKLHTLRNGKTELRNRIGFYPQYELMGTHTMRRSCATNLYGKVPNSSIMKMMGWTVESTMVNYVKLSGTEIVADITLIYNQSA